MGHHTFLVRYDTANYNSGDDWYGARLYTERDNGRGSWRRLFASTEISAGYLYAFKSEKLKAANIKINYINRSRTS